MQTTAAPAPSAPRPEVGAGQVFLNDAHLALTALNQARYLALRRMFGVPREQANLLTGVIVLSGAGATYEAARRLLHTPLGPYASDALMGGFVLREGAYGLAGPAARKVPLAGALLTFAMMGAIAGPGLRRAAHEVREAERRVRAQRLRIYGAIGRAPTA